MLYIYIFLSVLIVSLVSFVGILTIAFNEKRLKKITMFLVSLSVGTLLGGSFFHIIPEVIEKHGNDVRVWYFLIFGILSFFVLEKVISWRHCHNPGNCGHKHPVGAMNLVGDGIHNFIDGIIIAGAYLVDINLGIATTIAVALHEVPQEMGDFGVLIFAGYSKMKALLCNFMTAILSFVGAILVVFMNVSVEVVSLYVLPFAAGGFIYIATSDLLPELKKENRTWHSLGQVLAVVLGVLLMMVI